MKRCRLIMLTIFIWLTVAVAWGQQITVKPDGGRLLGYAAAASPGKWVVFAAGFLEVKPEVISGGSAIIFQGPAGEYAVVYFGPDANEPVVSKVVLGGGGPDPFPPKPPDPKPPVPGGPYRILLLYDTEQLDNLPPDQRALLTSLVYRQKLTEAGHRVLGVFAAQTINPANASKYKEFFAAAANDPLPRIVIAPLAGGKVSDFPLPANMADLEKLLATEVLP
jgi:hypothetical protein